VCIASVVSVTSVAGLRDCAIKHEFVYNNSGFKRCYSVTFRVKQGHLIHASLCGVVEAAQPSNISQNPSKCGAVYGPWNYGI
jgi:hypothetical protein